MIDVKTKQFIWEHLESDVRKLALEQKKYSSVNLKLAVEQINARRVLSKKVPSWCASEDVVFPPQLSLEQCSSELTAGYKAKFLKGKRLVDLTGGMGVDCSCCSSHFDQIDYVEQQQRLCELAENNFPALGFHNITVHNENSIDYLSRMDPVSWIYIDPARRDVAGRKVALPEDCEPDVVKLQELMLGKAEQVMIKLSPMMDIAATLKAFPTASTVFVVAVKNECKELLVILEQTIQVEQVVTCVNIIDESKVDEFSFTLEEERRASGRVGCEVEEYLYEPNAALMKAGPYKLLAERFQLSKLHISSHLYTGNVYHDSFPGRVFKVDQVFGMDKKSVKELASLAGANVAVRNLPMSAEELKKKLKLRDGGDIYLFGTTLSDQSKVVIKCRK